MATWPDEDHGSFGAPKGSAEWARAVRLKLRTLLKRVEDQENELGTWVRSLHETRGWALLLAADGLPFTSWEAFCSAPWPFGLGVDAGRIAAEIERRSVAQHLALDPSSPPLAQPGQIGRGRVRDRVDIINSKGGTQAAYLVRRLKRDAPEIAERLGRGEFRSARAAAIAAGLPVPRRLQLSATDATRAVRKLVAHYGLEVIAKLVIELANEQDKP